MNPPLGIALKVSSVLVFTLMVTCIKATANTVPTGEVVFIRSFFALIPILGYLAYRRRLPSALKTQNVAGHFFRGMVGATGMWCGFFALGLLPLPEVIAIGYAAPLLATGMAAIFLGEVVRVYRWSAVFTGLVGVLIILSPRLTVGVSGFGSSTESLGATAALAGAIFAATATVLVRRLVQTEQSGAIVFYFSIIASLSGLCSLPFGWTMPDPVNLALLIGAGIFGGIGQTLLTESYRHADTSTIAPFEYSSLLFGLTIGFFLFGEVPTGIMLVGAAIVVAAGIFIIFREHQLGLERARARKVMTPQG
jgi:drug/metabolite transporter (DMT)-like permease